MSRLSINSAELQKRIAAVQSKRLDRSSPDELAEMEAVEVSISIAEGMGYDVQSFIQKNGCEWREVVSTDDPIETLSALGY